MTPDQIQQVLDAIKSIGGIAAKGAEAGFAILVQQQIVNGIILFSWALIMLIGSYVIQRAVRRYWVDPGDWDFDAARPYLLVVGIMTTIGLIAGAMTCITIGLSDVLVPQAQVIQNLLPGGNS